MLWFIVRSNFYLTLKIHLSLKDLFDKLILTETNFCREVRVLPVLLKILNKYYSLFSKIKYSSLLHLLLVFQMKYNDLSQNIHLNWLSHNNAPLMLDRKRELDTTEYFMHLKQWPMFDWWMALLLHDLTSNEMWHVFRQEIGEAKKKKSSGWASGYGWH